jgi:hypothetical protein
MCETNEGVAPLSSCHRFQAQYVFDALPLREVRSLHCVFAAFHLMLGNYLTTYSMDSTVNICLISPQMRVQAREVFTRASGLDMGLCIQRQLTGEPTMH